MKSGTGVSATSVTLTSRMKRRHSHTRRSAPTPHLTIAVDQPCIRHHHGDGPGLSDANIDAVVDCFSGDYLRETGAGSLVRHCVTRVRCAQRLSECCSNTTTSNGRRWPCGRAADVGLTQWSDDAGTRQRISPVGEVDRRSPRLRGRFDGDDFDSAYDELERRYYAPAVRRRGIRDSVVRLRHHEEPG